jgi:acyl-CoA thioesterase-1
MRRSLLLIGLAWLFFLPAVSLAQEKPRPDPGAKRRSDPAFVEVKDDPALPRVLLIGDSISIGYTVPVRTLLQGKANVHRIPENGGPTSRGVEKIDRWLGQGKWDVIHFNWGLHDLRQSETGQYQVPLEQYEKNLRQLVKKMQASGARLIWASTTPVPEGKLAPPRRNSDVQAYNAVARKIMEENKIAIDDLYAFALPRLEKIQRPVNVHFTPTGSHALAEKVVESIRAALAR